MNTLKGSVDQLTKAYLAAARRAPLTVRVLEMLVVSALYVGGLVLVDQATGRAHVPVAVYAMFTMPIVLSVGLRLYRQVENRLKHSHGRTPHTG